MCLMVCLYNTDQLTMRNLPNKESYLMGKKSTLDMMFLCWSRIKKSLEKNHIFD